MTLVERVINHIKSTTNPLYDFLSVAEALNISPSVISVAFSQNRHRICEECGLAYYKEGRVFKYVRIEVEKEEAPLTCLTAEDILLADIRKEESEVVNTENSVSEEKVLHLEERLAAAENKIEQLLDLVHLLRKEQTDMLEYLTSTEVEDESNDTFSVIEQQVINNIQLNDSVVSEKRNDLPKIAIHGLLPVQKHRIQKIFGHRADIRYFDNDTDVTKSLKTVLSTTDMCFIHIKHISHSAQTAIQQSGVQFRRVGGGVSSMINAVQMYLEGK